MAAASEAIEKDMDLLGATAVEDKLQVRRGCVAGGQPHQVKGWGPERDAGMPMGWRQKSTASSWFSGARTCKGTRRRRLERGSQPLPPLRIRRLSTRGRALQHWA